MKNFYTFVKLSQAAIVSLIMLSGIFLNFSPSYSQIYEPEGLNMPGGWNEWTNPPVNNLALASFTQVPGGRITKISSGTTRWQTNFSVAESGGDIPGGSYEWLFTSGASGNPWSNKWANVTVSMNTLQSYTFNSGANNQLTVVNGKWYTMNWQDSGYTGTQAIFMETSAQPVNLLSPSVPSAVAASQPAEITLTTDATPSPEELFYLVYTTNNWVSSDIVSFNMAGNSGTATIPGQDPGAVVVYYAFSSTATGIADNYYLYAIKHENNNGFYYSYTVSGLSSQADILNFTFPEQAGPALINPLAATVNIEVLPGTVLTALTPSIVVSPGASVDPASGVSGDFTAPVTYTVSAEDGITTKEWTVHVTIAAPNYGIRDYGGINLPTFTFWYTGQGADLTLKGNEFNNQPLGPLSSLLIKGANIKTWKTGTGDVTGTQFRYKVWNISDAEPLDYTVRNVNWTSNDGDGYQTWSSFGTMIGITDGLIPGSYNLKILFAISGSGIPGVTEDGPFAATFEVQELNTEAEILDFVLAGQTGPAVINSGAATVNTEVANGTPLLALTPTITISANAIIDPESGVARDFTNPVTYTVTSESLSQKVWTVTVTVAPPPSIGWANLQWPADGNIVLNQAFNVYAQVFADGVTNEAGQGAGMQAWIGFNTENTNPDTWTNWVPAAFQGDAGNNDEYTVNLGAAITAPGTYYYASRFQLDGQDVVYGGFQGGFWNGSTNISGVLTVNAVNKILNLTVLLEGLYNGNGLMRQANGETGPQYGSGIADLITVELHNESDYSIVEQSFPNVELGTGGSATVSVPAIFSGNYYLTIRHRNSIETTTANPVSLAGQLIAFSFDQPFKAYGNNLLQMSDGWYAVYGGDASQDGYVDTGDVTQLDNDQFNFAAGYVASDVNGDGFVDTGDITVVDNNQFSFVGSAHP